jgi:hypothetical protein
VRVNHFAAPDPVRLRPGQRVPLEALADANASQQGMRFHWEIRPEVVYGAYAGSGEQLPAAVPACIEGERGAQAVLKAPEPPGAYRVFAFLYDAANRFATANLPVLVE